MKIIDQKQQALDTVEYVLKKAKALGADAIEVDIDLGQGLDVQVHMQEVEKLEFHNSKSLGLNIYKGQRKGSASCTDFSKEAIDMTIEKAITIASYTSDDPFNGLPAKALMAWDYPDLDLYHPWHIEADQAILDAKTYEKAGLDFDPRIVNSGGVNITTIDGLHVYGNSLDFIGHFLGTRHSISGSFMAEAQGQKQRDFDYTTNRDPILLMDGKKIATKAAKKALERLGAVSIKTCHAPVIFNADIAKGLFASFLAAISGGNLYRETSFLLNKLGQAVFPNFMTIEEKAFIPKALGSVPFDSEGVRPQDKKIIQDGILNSYLLSEYSARKLNMQTTGNAGGTHNVFVNHGQDNLETLIKKMHRGLIVTEVLGHGINLTTGDYSRGAAGFWVENGAIAHPVEGVTVAGKLQDMFKQIIAIGNDVDDRGSLKTGSVFIEQMTIAGD